MAASPGYRDYVRARLSTAGPVRFKAMFGGYGIYSEEWFYALISSSDQLYFKTDAYNRADYLERGMAQFMTMPYYAVPPDVLDDDARLHAWVEKAVDAARRSRKPKKRAAGRPGDVEL